MAAVKSIKFLPSIFQTETNKKFLNATVDQLISEPSFKKINGYIGRRFAPTFKKTDNYVIESDKLRQDYQLEPGVTVAEKDNILLHVDYIDLLQKIKYYGGLTDNQSRLFENECYSFDGQVDLDKLVNFNQYYWLPTGPQEVDVFSGAVDYERTFTITVNQQQNAFNVSGFGDTPNPDITLVRGGKYKFLVNGETNFWIQTEPGLTGFRKIAPNIPTRRILGVDNNGVSQGEIVFHVPDSGAQNFYVDMPLIRHVDYGTSIPFNEIHNNLLSTFIAKYKGFDGPSANFAGKYLVFVSNDPNDYNWSEKGRFDRAFDCLDGYDAGIFVPQNQRTGIWQINIDTADSVGHKDGVIKLSYVADIPVNHKVYITNGTTNGNKEFFKSGAFTLQEVPVLTALMDTLYYADSVSTKLIGRIKIIDTNAPKLDIAKDILGKKVYTSPNGVAFTNGLKIRFDQQVTPEKYANKTYYVEGVGKSIRLVDVDSLITPEFNEGSLSVPFDSYGFDTVKWSQALNGPLTPDYITINRSSIDLNAWSRSNRWFHQDVITLTAKYNKTIPNYDQIQRAKRPIIEFEPDLKLFNNGHVSRHVVDILDFDITDSLNQIEGRTSPNGVFVVSGIQLNDGMTVVFANDVNPEMRNRVFRIRILDVTQGGTTLPTLHLELTKDPEILPLETVTPAVGFSSRKSYWYTGTIWKVAQHKTKVNQAPKFDIIDNNGNSFGDITYYPNTVFTGTTLFTYATGAGKDDEVLGFPLKYRSFNNVGDIEFVNSFNVDSFTYINESVVISRKISDGFIAKIDENTFSLTKINMWRKVKHLSKQSQVFSYVYQGNSKFFEIDIRPDAKSADTVLAKVLVNNKIIDESQYEFTYVGVIPVIEIKAPLTVDDKIDVLVYSNTPSKIGHYEVPLNLDLNSLNKDFMSLTLGQMRNHLVAFATNSLQVKGAIPGNSNLRDIQIKDQLGSILQHSAPVVYSSLFLVEKQLNFISAIGYAQKEYSRFKNRFLEATLKLKNLHIVNPVESVDTILKSLNAVKNSSFPWFYSDMVPYGDVKNVIEYTVLNTAIVDYEISQVFNDTELSNKSVLVYVNGVQQIKGLDFYFSKTIPAITFIRELNYDDVIRIVEYEMTIGCYIPETPTKLGLYPSFVPCKFLDDTYVTPINVIRGHDGSLTPAFNDFRDDILLELERRIYNNIKVHSNAVIDIIRRIPGKFRNSSYTTDEFNQVISQEFLKWVGENKVDYTTNRYFDANNSWTWNYSDTKDRLTNERLLGYWRGIYRCFYDTETPNTTPWEMLGFSVKPVWWEKHYGPAPYTGGNLVLWNDLEAGLIREGDRAGIDLAFARPGLSKIIPVTDNGLLRSPVEFLVSGFSGTNTSGSFVFGDVGPAESAWRKSSNYPYAVQVALALMYPGFYFGSLMNVDTYFFDKEKDQYLIKGTNNRITPYNIKINGETNSDTIVTSAGYLNWIRDYIVSLGILNPSAKIRQFLNNLDVKLSYKVGGYTDKTYTRFLAEQSSPTSVNESVVIPPEDYAIYLHKSPPVAKIAFSAVIIEKSDSGFVVKGYDLSSPYFTIVPSEQNSNNYIIDVLGTRAIVYNDFVKVKVNIPYGTEFTSKQQVCDFLISYGRYLTGLGFKFDQFNSDLQLQQDWTLSVREFLTWAQQGWSSGSLIVLNPSANSIWFSNRTAVVDEITNTPDGSKVMDQNFNVIKTNNLQVVRDDNDFSVTTVTGQTIAFLELNLVQFEHSVIFNNETMFNDVIYKPELGNRQYRLKYVGSKTDGWSGKFEAPGFIYSSPTFNVWRSGTDYLKGDLVKYKNSFYTALANIVASEVFEPHNWALIPDDQIKLGLLPNLATNAKKAEWIYDIDASHIDSNLERFSHGLVGFRNRGYLEDLSLEVASQVKLYQGFIKEKGTRNAVTALTKAEFNNLSGSIDFYEEWGIRVGEYGALESNKELDIILRDNEFTKDPIAMSFVPTTDQRAIHITTDHCYKTPMVTDCGNVFKSRSGESVYDCDIKTAGYVSLEDIDLTIFDINNYNDLSTYINKIGSGFRIWVAKDQRRDWNVYRITETENQTISVRYLSDGTAEVITEFPHSLRVNEIFAFKGIAALVDGFYQTVSVSSIDTVVVRLLMNDDALTEFKEKGTITGRAILYKLISLRFKQCSDIVHNVPIHNWKTIDKVWVDETGVDKKWGVFSKNEPWESTEQYALGVTESVDSEKYGTFVKLSPDSNLVLVSRPKAGAGEVKAYIRGVNVLGAAINELQSLHPPLSGTQGFGECIDISNRLVVITAPNTVTGGEVFVYSKLAAGDLLLQQRIQESPNEKFGSSITLSSDSKWLYVGAPGANKVYCYSLEEVVNDTIILDDPSLYYSTDPAFDGEEIPISIISQDATIISSGSTIYFPGIHYTITDNLLKFLVDPGTTAISITLRSYFKLNTILTDSRVQHFWKYGYSIKTNHDGSKLIVGAPAASVENDRLETVMYAGTAFVYGRTSAGIKLLEELAPRKITYNAQFGTAVEMSLDGKKMFVGAPYYTEDLYKSGLVNYFVDVAEEFKSITTVEQHPVLTPGGSIFINDVEVIFHLTTLDDLVGIIEFHNIPGIRAANVDGYLNLTATGKNARLSILPGTGDLYKEIGFNPIVQLQEIRYPIINYRSTELFGNLIKYETDSETLVIESKYADIFANSRFDNNTTVFDNRTTFFYDRVYNSGAVYVFELLHSANNTYGNSDKFGYVQQLSDPGIKSFDHFGCSIDIVGNYIVASAPYDDEPNKTDIGRVYSFTNKNKVKGWEKIREETPRVDFNYLNEMFIFHPDTNAIITYLDYIDPVKGKILGIAEQDIDYKTTADPAIYNRSTLPHVTVSSDYSWGSFQVGNVWWNLDLVRYVDYEQGSLSYRLANWGRLFPGAEIEILEWVESDVLPSAYVANGGDGVPKYEDNSAYVETFYVHPVTNILQSKYYFWVKDKQNNTSKDKHRPISVIADIVRNPKGQGIPYAAILGNSAVGLFNYNSALNSDKAVLHIEYSEVLKKHPVHSEFELLQEGNYNSTLPNKIVEKLIDSLAGKDKADRNVPDIKLKLSERFGINVRPRQSMFVNRLAAVRNLVTFVNSVFAQHPIAVQFDIQGLYRKEEAPSEIDDVWQLKVANREELEYVNLSAISAVGEYSGYGDETFDDYLFDIGIPFSYKVLVEQDYEFDNLWTLYKLVVLQDDDTSTISFKWVLDRVQSYDTSRMWRFVNWTKPGFDNTVVTTYTVQTEKEMYKLHLNPGDTIRVRDNGKGQFLIYETKSDLSKELVSIQNGTIELLPDLFNGGIKKVGYDADFYDSGRFDLDVSEEIRAIVETLRDSIFVKNLSVEFNKLFFSMMNFSLSEKQFNDWLFKTSFISVNHKLRKLEEFPNYIKDNQEYYRDYINEIKPYRTKIREYLLNYEAIDKSFVNTTDFDLPPYYDDDLNVYRSPNFEYARDDEIITRDEYKDWHENYTSVIGKVIIQNSGAGYILEPVVTLVGGGGSGAKLRALIDYYTGAITQIIVLDPGSGYTSTPTVVINGTGINGKAYAVLSNNKIRSISTTIKFDRITYTSNIVEWRKNVRFQAGSVVSFNGNAYRAISDTSPANYFDYTQFELLDASNFDNANDRAMAYYKPTVGMPGKDLTQLYYGIEFPGNIVSGIKFNEGRDTGYSQDTANLTLDTILKSSFSGAESGISPDDVTVSGNKFIDKYHSHAPEELLPGMIFDTLEMRVFTLTNQNQTLGYRIFHSMTSEICTPKLSFVSDGLRKEYPLIHSNDLAFSVRLFKKRVRNTENGLWAVATIDLTVADIGEHLTVTVESPDVSLTGENYTLGFVIESGRIVFDNFLADDEIVEFVVYKSTNVKNYILSYKFVGNGTRNTYLIFNDLSLIRITTDSGVRVLNNSEFLFYNGRILLNESPAANAIVEIFTTPNINANREYYRISDAHTVHLAQPLHITDSEIIVSSAEPLPEPSKENLNPGVIFVNGEKITYYEIDRSRNALKQIRRAVSGTGAPQVHPVGSIVSDSSLEQKIMDAPGSPTDTSTWLNPSTSGQIVDGQGLAMSNTPQALFIKESPSYTP